MCLSGASYDARARAWDPFHCARPEHAESTSCLLLLRALTGALGGAGGTRTLVREPPSRALRPTLRTLGAFGSNVAPMAVAAVVSLAVISLGWLGVDWPAQLYRVHLFRANGWVAFDTGWYGGHVRVAYSTLFPPIAATIGVTGEAVACAAVAAWAFDRLVVGRYGPRARLGSMCFAVGTVVQVAIGQLSFLLGLALGLLAVLALASRRPVLAALLGVSCALASFVAALFLVLAAIASAATTHRERQRQAVIVALATVVPVAVVALLYRQAGRFPFPATSLAGVLVVCAGSLLIVPRSDRVLRVGAGLYAGVAAFLFVVQTPMGANITRLGTSLAIPVLLCVVPRTRRTVLAILAAFVVTWQLSPAVGAVDIQNRDPSTNRAYFAPLLAELRRVAPQPSRVEIPFTHQHWEASMVAPSVSLARGWERQLDIVENPVFYRPDALNGTTYHRWLDDKGVTWVALPDVPLDYSARAEAALLRRGLSYLKPVWHNADWQLWQVRGSPGLLSGPGRLTSLSADDFTVDAFRAGTITVRVRYTPQWSITDDDHRACLSATTQGWTTLHATRAATVRVMSQLLPTAEAGC